MALHDGIILVTGGAGFIGSAVVQALNQRGHQRILIADFLDRSSKWRNLAPLRFDDYLDAGELLPLLERGTLTGIRTIFHLGACSSTTETDAGYLLKNNFDYTRRLAEWALRHDARFVYASSAATYGAQEGLLADTADIRPLRPLNAYGYSKQLFDLHAATRGYLDRLAGLKYFNVFGPNEEHKGDMRSMVSKAFQQIRGSGQVSLFRSHRPDFADGCQQRDFIYVKDAVQMTLHVAAHPDANGLFNVGSGHAHTWIELVTAVFTALDLPPRIEFIDMPETLRRQYQYSTCASIDRIRATGYAAPITPLADAVLDYVRHYLAPGLHLGDEQPATTLPVSL